jgi:thiol-disulfide isomerase/thioredoxin
MAGALLLCAAAASAAPRVGDAAPALVGETLKGEGFDLAELRGHVVVVNLWATWCPPCRAEMPMLDAFYKARQDEGLILVGASADRRRDLGEVRKVMASFSYPAVMLTDAKVNGFGAPRALPIIYLIDAKGSIAAVLVAGDTPLTQAQLAAAVTGSAASDK